MNTHERLVDIAVINLDRRVDRMECIQRCSPFNVISDYTDKNLYSIRRFSAVDGNNLSTYYKTNPEYRALLDTIRGQSRVLGEVGCTLSHYSLWLSHAYNPKNKYLLVFEDDVMFTDKSVARFSDTINQLKNFEWTSGPSRFTSMWDVMYVGGQWTPDYNINSNNTHFNFQNISSESLDTYFKPMNLSPENTISAPAAEGSRISSIYKRNNRFSAVIHNDKNVWYTPLFRTAGAYMVSQNGAKKLLEAVENDTALFMKTPLDMWILEMDFRGYIDVFDSLPHPFYQSGFNTAIEPSHIENDIHRTKYDIVTL